MRKNDGDWFPLSSDYPTHRKTFHLVELLGDIGEVYPVRLMCWLRDQENVDGVFRTDSEVERAALWRGTTGALVAALRTACILDGLTYHGWAEKGGKLVAQMLEARRRTEEWRNANGTRTVGIQNGYSTSKKEKEKEKEKTEAEKQPCSGTGPELFEVSTPPPSNKPAAKRVRVTIEYPEDFERRWKAWPSGAGKAKAFEEWQKIPPELHAPIDVAIAAQKTWPRFEGQVWKHFSTWLRGRCWEDRPPANFKSVHIPHPAERVIEKWVNRPVWDEKTNSMVTPT